MTVPRTQTHMTVPRKRQRPTCTHHRTTHTSTDHAHVNGPHHGHLLHSVDSYTLHGHSTFNGFRENHGHSLHSVNSERTTATLWSQWIQKQPMTTLYIQWIQKLPRPLSTFSRFRKNHGHLLHSLTSGRYTGPLSTCHWIQKQSRMATLYNQRIHTQFTASLYMQWIRT